MGRKEDEEDQKKVSKDTNGSCIEELAKKCKPLNVQLSRLDLPKNGIVLIKDNTSDRLKDINFLNTNDGESSDSVVVDVHKAENEENSNDTAETIKKIKEFIALGRCEETKKDQDSSDKRVGYRGRVLTKRKLLNKKDAKTPSKKSSTSVDRLNAEHNLERTLKEADSDNDDAYSVTNDVKSHIDSKHSEDGDLKYDDNGDGTDKHNDLLVTPSRVSKRIQSKPVKFSVKKMLRGDDVNVLKRMIPGYENKTPSKKERSTEKKLKIETKKLTTPVVVLNSPPHEPSPDKEIIKPTTPPPLSTTPDHNDNVETRTPSPELSPNNTVEALLETKEKLAALSDKIGKFAIGNGKITLELKGSQQKKVVRIAMPPPPNQSSLPKTALGPDIIIKRVKPVKKTVVIPDDSSLGVKGVIEKEVFVEHNSQNTPTISKDNKLLPRVKLERIATPKLKESLAKINKNLLRHAKSDKRLDKIDVKDSKQNSNSEIISASQDKAISVSKDVSASCTKEKSPITIIANDKNDSVSADSPSRMNVDEKLVLAESPPANVEKSSFQVQDEARKQPSGEKSRGRKTAKVTPLTQVKSKVEPVPTKDKDKIQKSDVVQNKSKFWDVPDLTEPENETYNSLFDRYFSTRERYVEHHDSLDSDSSDGHEDEIYAHFINLRKRKELAVSGEEKKDDSLTMYDLMQDITLELPTWNIHVSSDGQAFCLAQVDIVDNVPVMKKVIEINLDYNAKVFVGGTLKPEFEGNYSGYEDIRQLIYDVDQL